MCAVRKFCCCVDLRVGAIVIAILEIIITGGGYSYFGALFELYSASVCAGVLSLIAGLCLLIGSIKYNKIGSIVYLVLKMIHIVGTMVVTILLALIFFGALKPMIIGIEINDSIDGVGFALVSTIYFLIYLLCTPINIYLWGCVFSFYKGMINEEIISPA